MNKVQVNGMLQKAEVLNLINSIKNEQNEGKLQRYIDLVNSMDNDTFNKFILEHKLDSLERLKAELESRVNNTNEQTNSFIKLNELVSYGRSKKTIHIHVVPKDAHSFLTKEGRIKAENLLIDALEQIREMMKTDQTITNVYAVSDIIQSLIAKMFEGLGFDVKVLPLGRAKDDLELGFFYENFKDSNLGKLGRAQISRKKLLSLEWEEKKEERKKELEEKSNRRQGQNR